MKPKLPPEPDLLGDALEENGRLRNELERLRAIADELCLCAATLGWTSCEEPHWIQRGEKAVKAYEDFKS